MPEPITTPTRDMFGLNANQVITAHSASDCEAPCPLHSPSDQRQAKPI